MPHEVVMPQLGMTQNTGTIVAWLKSKGDPVGSDETLMEVETDKSTVEVPAGRTGVVVSVRHPKGAVVPVGEVVAVIALDGEDQAIESTTPASPTLKVPKIGTDNFAKSESDPVVNSGAGVVGWKRSTEPATVLASPKARKLARERGLDLRDLLKRGIAEPVHARDVKSISLFVPTHVSEMSILATSVAINDFLELVAAVTSMAGRMEIFGALASGALRRTIRRDGPIAVSCRKFGRGGYEKSWVDADRLRIRAIRGAPAFYGDPDLVVIDLVDSRLAGYNPGIGHPPSLVVAARNDGFLLLTLRFQPDRLSPETALEFLEELAGRMENPIRNLM